MKIVLFITALVFAGCVQKASADIEGVYTRESAGEFSRAFDTLIIYKYDSIAGAVTYLIRRKTGYIRITHGVPQPKQNKDEKMLTVYNGSTNQLMDKKTGRMFSFKDGALLFGTAEYKKVTP
jgi:hypothetical protein